MTTPELARLVRTMREAQTLYFRHRDRDSLVRSKELERKVDKVVADCLDAQVTLFGMEDT